MNIKHEYIRPDRIMPHQQIYSPASKQWEFVKDCYWSEETQRYVLWYGPLGMGMMLFGCSEKAYVRSTY